MQQMPIDKLLMALSVLLTSPENYLQINSENVDDRNILRTADNAQTTCMIQEMLNLSSVMDTAMANQIQIKDKINQMLTDLQATVKLLSTDYPSGCGKQQEGNVIIKLPNMPIGFPVWCTANTFRRNRSKIRSAFLTLLSEFGDNWLLIANRDAYSTLFSNTSTESVENSIGHFEGEYFIGFKKLRAITENDMCELLILQSVRKDCTDFYYHNEVVAFGADNKVKVLGLHTTDFPLLCCGLTKHVEMVNLKLTLKSEILFTRIYLRRATLDMVPQLKNTT